MSHNQPHKLNRILESKLNSASRSPNSAQRFLRKRFRSLDRSRWKLNTTLSMDRVGNSTQRSLWIALETQHNALYGSRWKLSTTLS
ncbi:hypothetical protein [Leptospira noguchii]|uniref:Uncharacterized protein n=1 Tax=Leptospira noguchii TaxID=28182 RepID=A0AAE9GFC1_9LEPT|nr:hypothetical protein [Leptospira noguchii]UOG56336.1 hypothetical protein MAL03_16260 [Leptospira noguchii]